MLKRLKKRIEQRNFKKAKILSATISAIVALSIMPSVASALEFSGPLTVYIPNSINGDNLVVHTGVTVNMSGMDTSPLGINYNQNYHGLVSDFCAVYTDGGTINLSNVNIAGNSYGIVSYGGTVSMSNGKINSGSYSVYTEDGSVKLTNVVLTDSIYTQGGVTTIRDSRMITPGIAADSWGGNTTLTDTAIQAGDAAFYANGGNITAAVHGQSISGSNYLMNADSGSIDLIAYNRSQLYGKTVINSGTANLSLNSGATWTTPESSTLTNLALNSGNVVFTAPTDIFSSSSYRTLAVNSFLSGRGNFYLNSNLSSGYADRISGAANVSGDHQLYVRNFGGTPSDLSATVKLTNLTGTNTASFGGGSDVSVYRYAVAKGSTLSSYYTYGGSPVSGSDYYLYNTFAPSTPVKVAMSDNAANNVMGYGEMNEIKKRMGELRMGNQSSDDFWARTYAEKFDVRPNGSEAFDQTVNGIEIGKDNPQAFNGGKRYTGFLVGYGKASNDFSSGGSGNVHSTYLGSYASWLRDDGVYFDLIGKYNWFRHSFDTPLMGGGSDSGSYNNRGVSLSAEVGKRFQRSNGYFVEPAVELTGLWSTAESYSTSNGLDVDVPSSRSLLLRLGCTMGRKWQGNDGVNHEFYGKAGWVNEYEGDSTTTVDSNAFDSSLKGHQWVTGLGYIEDTRRHQLYMDVEKSWGNTTSKEWGMNAGYRWKF